MQRFALSLALMAMLAFGLAGAVIAADTAGTDTTATKQAAPATPKRRCLGSRLRACRKGKKKATAPTTDSTGTTPTTK